MSSELEFVNGVMPEFDAQENLVVFDPNSGSVMPKIVFPTRTNSGGSQAVTSIAWALASAGSLLQAAGLGGLVACLALPQLIQRQRARARLGP